MARSLHALSGRTLFGKTLDMASLAGKAVVVANVASRCGFAPPTFSRLAAWHAQHGTAPAPGYGYGGPPPPPQHGPMSGAMNGGAMNGGAMNGGAMSMPMYGGNGGWVPQGAEYY